MYGYFQSLYPLDSRGFVLENMLYMTVAMAVTPDSVQMPVASVVKPLIFPYKNITMMVAELMQWFVVFHLNRMR